MSYSFPPSTMAFSGCGNHAGHMHNNQQQVQNSIFTDSQMQVLLPLMFGATLGLLAGFGFSGGNGFGQGQNIPGFPGMGSGFGQPVGMSAQPQSFFGAPAGQGQPLFPGQSMGGFPFSSGGGFPQTMGGFPQGMGNQPINFNPQGLSGSPFAFNPQSLGTMQPQVFPGVINPPAQPSFPVTTQQAFLQPRPIQNLNTSGISPQGVINDLITNPLQQQGSSVSPNGSINNFVTNPWASRFVSTQADGSSTMLHNNIFGTAASTTSPNSWQHFVATPNGSVTVNSNLNGGFTINRAG